MLRVSDNQPEDKTVSYLSIDKKKRQVTLSEPTLSQTPQSLTSAQERGPMVSAPKMFAFDALHTSEDSQVMYQCWAFPGSNPNGTWKIADVNEFHPRLSVEQC